MSGVDLRLVSRGDEVYLNPGDVDDEPDDQMDVEKHSEEEGIHGSSSGLWQGQAGGIVPPP